MPISVFSNTLNISLRHLGKQMPHMHREKNLYVRIKKMLKIWKGESELIPDILIIHHIFFFTWISLKSKYLRGWAVCKESIKN